MTKSWSQFSKLLKENLPWIFGIDLVAKKGSNNNASTGLINKKETHFGPFCDKQ